MNFKFSSRRGLYHHHLLISSSSIFLYFLYLLLLTTTRPTWGQLEGAEPLTKELFEASFDGHQGKDFFRQFFSAAQVFSRSEDGRQLVPVLACLVYLREYGKGLMVKACAKKFKEHPLIDKRLRHFLLAYRCFYSSNPHDYELHTATVEKIALSSEGWTVSFRPQEAYLCRVRWTVAETVQLTMAYLKEHGLLRGQLREGVVEEVHLDGERIEPQLAPLTPERFEAAFTKLRREFHIFPFFGYIFTRDLRDNGAWTEVKECFLNLGLTPGRAIVISRCVAIISQYQKIDPFMSNLYVVYRCFKSDSPYDYELISTPILKLYTEFPVDPVDGRLSYQYSASSSTPTERSKNGVIFFRPFTGDHCKIGLMGSRPIDALLFAHFLNDTGVVANGRIDGGGRVKVEPLTREAFEAAFPLASGFQSRPYLTYVFARDLETVLTRTLLPLRSCQVLLYEEGRGVISASCAELLGHYSAIDSQNLHNFLLLPYRCFHHRDTERYDLLNASITGLAMDAGQYVLSFRPKEAVHCAPVWAKDYRLKEEEEDDEKVDMDPFAPFTMVFKGRREEL